MMNLVNCARDETEFFQIGRRVLPLLLKWHEDLVGDELEDLVRNDPRYRRIFKGQISSNVTGFIDRYNIGPIAQVQMG